MSIGVIEGWADYPERPAIISAPDINMRSFDFAAKAERKSNKPSGTEHQDIQATVVCAIRDPNPEHDG